ncbi:cyclodeaminase/cyclohydrolase family protein [Glutamicibacter sp. X7]
MIKDEPIGAYLERLASRAPTPGGGAVGALHAAQGAALVSMVALYSTGEKFKAHEARAQAMAARAQELITQSLNAADEDETAFASVIAAYRLPATTEAEKAVKTAQIQQALGLASRPPQRLVALSIELIDLCSELKDFGNPNVLSDVAVAAESARAAIGTSLATLEINIAEIRDPDVGAKLRACVALGERAVIDAEDVARGVRQVVAA